MTELMTGLRDTLYALRKQIYALHGEIYTLAKDIDSIPDADAAFVAELWNTEDGIDSAAKSVNKLLHLMEDAS